MSLSAPYINCGMERVDAIKITLATTVTAGLIDKREDTVGFYMEAGVSGDVVAFVYRAPKCTIAKSTLTGVVFTAGDKVYYNDYINKVTNNSSGNTLIGIALEDAVAADTTLLIDFDGKPLS